MDTTFDLVMRDDLFVLYADGKPFFSSSGHEVSHSNARLLRLCINHEIYPVPGRISPLALLVRLTDSAAGSASFFDFDLESEISLDPLLSGETNRFPELHAEWVAENPEMLELLFLNASSLVSSLNNFFLKKGQNQTKSGYFRQVISEMSAEKLTALNALHLANEAGVVIHTLILNEFLCMTEYADAVYILTLMKRSPFLQASDLSFDKNSILRFREKVISDVMPAVDFITLCKSENKMTVIEEIIKRGEDNSTEFKSTLRWDIRQGLKSSAIEHASLKTICAFLNSEGGDLLIGVRDDGTIEGIGTDRFENNDRFLLHLWTLIKSCLGDEVVEWVRTSLQEFGPKTVCRVKCGKAATPVFLRQKGFEEAFFVRTGPGSNNLEISSALKYIEQHF